MRQVSTQIGVRVDPVFKAEVEAVFSSIGLKPAEAIRMFLQQTINRGELPFVPSVAQPNGTTLKAMRKAEKGEDVTNYDNLDEMFEDLGL